ncbi:MAG TPA: ferritin [Planctomycetota bacterium]|nr:ferritin [Planctomycetota bacterium]HRR79216.1 ferritin [Planctomycetota bacterium]HRT94241.1 ferritin [Planctomycetota bacterium]
MLSKKMEEALNKQVNAELFSSYLYLAMAADFEAKNLPGFAHWLKLQAKEENGHALKLYEYINDRRSRVTLAAIAAPPAEWATPLAAFEAVLAHEQKVTGLINKLVELAAAEKDNATGILLQWFVTEQVEEEKNADAIVAQLKMIGESPHGLIMLDRALAQRG